MAKTSSESETLVYSPSEHHHLLKQAVQIHIDCIEREDTIMTFLPPLNYQKVTAWWEKQEELMGNGGPKTMLLQVDRSSNDGLTVLGCVILVDKSTETEPFHAWVEKMIVSPNHRRKGVARKLMTKLEEMAMSKGLTLIFLDTDNGNNSHLLYRSQGYTQYGYIPDYCVGPNRTKKVDGLLFYKDLLKSNHNSSTNPS